MAGLDDLESVLTEIPAQVLNRCVTERELSQVTRHIGTDFMIIGIELGLSSIKVQHIINDNQNRSQNQILQILIAWKNKEGKAATVRKLLNVLLGQFKDSIDSERIIDVFSCV